MASAADLTGYLVSPHRVLVRLLPVEGKVEGSVNTSAVTNPKILIGKLLHLAATIPILAIGKVFS